MLAPSSRLRCGRVCSRSMLANFGLGFLAVVAAIAVFVGVGAVTDYWNFALAYICLGALAAGLFLWRRAPYFAAAGVLAAIAGTLGLLGGGPEVGGVELAHSFGAAALLALFWPLVEIFVS